MWKNRRKEDERSSLTSLKEVLKDYDDEHREIEAGQASPYITTMEQYYFDNPRRYRAKIGKATWIPRSVREHMIAHVTAMLLKRKRDRERESRKVHRVTFRQFLEHPVAVRAFTARNVFTKTPDGRVVKRSRVSGRSARLNQAERREVARFRAMRRKEVKGQSA